MKFNFLKPFHIFFVAIFLLIGCAPTSVVSRKDPNVFVTIKNLTIWNSGGLVENYSTLIDRMNDLSSDLNKKFNNSSIKANFLPTKKLDLNIDESVQSLVKKNFSTHILKMNVIETRKRSISIAVEYYTIEFALIDISNKKEIWKSHIQADFYSSPEKMAGQVLDKLKSDGLI